MNAEARQYTVAEIKANIASHEYGAELMLQHAMHALDASAVQIKQLEAQLAMFSKAAKQVLSDIDDDGVAERSDMGILALRKAAALGPAEEIQSVVACAKRVHAKFGAESDWSEWRDLGAAIDELDNWALRP